jgi:hypothetical protein
MIEGIEPSITILDGLSIDAEALVELRGALSATMPFAHSEVSVVDDKEHLGLRTRQCERGIQRMPRVFCETHDIHES